MTRQDEIQEAMAHMRMEVDEYDRALAEEKKDAGDSASDHRADEENTGDVEMVVEEGEQQHQRRPLDDAHASWALRSPVRRLKHSRMIERELLGDSLMSGFHAKLVRFLRESLPEASNLTDQLNIQVSIPCSAPLILLNKIGSFSRYARSKRCMSATSRKKTGLKSPISFVATKTSRRVLALTASSSTRKLLRRQPLSVRVCTAFIGVFYLRGFMLTLLLFTSSSGIANGARIRHGTAV